MCYQPNLYILPIDINIKKLLVDLKFPLKYLQQLYTVVVVVYLFYGGKYNIASIVILPLISCVFLIICVLFPCILDASFILTFFTFIFYMSDFSFTGFLEFMFEFKKNLCMLIILRERKSLFESFRAHFKNSRIGLSPTPAIHLYSLV